MVSFVLILPPYIQGSCKPYQKNRTPHFAPPAPYPPLPFPPVEYRIYFLTTFFSFSILDLSRKGHRDVVVGSTFQFNEQIPRDLHITVTPPPCTDNDDDAVTKRTTAESASPNAVKSSDKQNSLHVMDTRQTLLKSQSDTTLEQPNRRSPCWRSQTKLDVEEISTRDIRKPRSRSLLTPTTSFERLSISPRIKVRSVSFVTANGFQFTVKEKK